MILFLIPVLLGLMVSLTAIVAVLAMSHPRPRLRRKDPVTVVVCARDEEDCIEDTLLSLAAQQYPHRLMSLILVDHLSIDRTGAIMDEFAEDCPVDTTVIHVTEDVGPLRGKVQGLDIALDRVKTEFVLFTDGDCVVPPTWVGTLLSYFEDDIAVVNGHVNVENPDPRGARIARWQHILNRMYLALSVGYSALQMPRHLWHPWLQPVFPALRRIRPSFNMGNNQGLRMSVYREIGGFRQVGQNLIEDVALVNRILTLTNYRTAVILDRDAVVTTRASDNIAEFFRQLRRWASASESMTNHANIYLYFVVFLMRVGLPWSILLHRRGGMTAITMVSAAEYLLLEGAARRLGERTPPRDMLVHLGVQIVLNHLLLAHVLLKKPVVWKGKTYPLR